MDPNPYAIDDDVLDAAALRASLDEWSRLRDAADRGDAYRGRVRTLATRVVAHRARLFDRNAKLMVDQPDVHEIEANQTAIKCATTILGEMTEAIGHASMPDQER